MKKKSVEFTIYGLIFATTGASQLYEIWKYIYKKLIYKKSVY